MKKKPNKNRQKLHLALAIPIIASLGVNASCATAQSANGGGENQRAPGDDWAARYRELHAPRDPSPVPIPPNLAANPANKGVKVDRMQLPPNNIMDLLKNIKYAAEHDVLMQEDFFDEKNLLAFCNGQSTRWSSNEANDKSVTVLNCRALQGEYNSIYFSKGFPSAVEPRDKIFVGLILRLQEFFTIEQVMEIFGVPQKLERGRLTVMGTHPLGDLMPIYEMHTAKTKTSVAVHVNGVGYVYKFNINQYLSQEGK